MDPRSRFPHPLNAELLDRLEPDGLPVSTMELDGYELLCHPDLVERLYEATEALPAVRAGAYGYLVAATRAGVIFGWAGGTGDAYLRLSDADGELACEHGAEPRPGGWWRFRPFEMGRTIEQGIGDLAYFAALAHDHTAGLSRPG